MHELEIQLRDLISEMEKEVVDGKKRAQQFYEIGMDKTALYELAVYIEKKSHINRLKDILNDTQ